MTTKYDDTKPGGNSSFGNSQRPPDIQSDHKPDDGSRNPAGPHAKPELSDDEKTPGTGSLPDRSVGDEADIGPG